MAILVSSEHAQIITQTGYSLNVLGIRAKKLFITLLQLLRFLNSIIVLLNIYIMLEHITFFLFGMKCLCQVQCTVVKMEVFTKVSNATFYSDNPVITVSFNINAN